MNWHASTGEEATHGCYHAREAWNEIHFTCDDTARKERHVYCSISDAPKELSGSLLKERGSGASAGRAKILTPPLIGLPLSCQQVELRQEQAHHQPEQCLATSHQFNTYAEYQGSLHKTLIQFSGYDYGHCEGKRCCDRDFVPVCHCSPCNTTASARALQT